MNNTREYLAPGGGLETCLSEMAAEGRFSGTVLAGKGGEVSFTGGYGWANRADKTTMDETPPPPLRRNPR